MRRVVVPLLWILLAASWALAAPPVIRPAEKLDALLKLIGSAEGGPQALAAQKKAARLAGMPLTPADIKHRPIPDERNAAVELRRFNQLLREKPLERNAGMIASRIATSQLTPAELAEVRQLLATRPDLLEAAHAAAAKPECDFNRDWSKGVELVFPEYATCREAVRLITAESVLLARDGKLNEAVENQAHGFRIARHSESDPIIIAYLVGVACRTISLSGLSAILNGSPPDAAAARKAVELLEANALPERYQRMFGGEIVMLTATLKTMRAGDYNSLTALAGEPRTARRALSPQERRAFVRFVDASEADCLGLYREAWSAAALPPTQRRKAMAVVAAHTEPDSSNLTHLIRTVFMPEFESLDKKYLQFLAREAAFRAGAKVLEARATTGQWPSALPATTTDPFSGKPLLYHGEGDGFVVYSVGASGKFAGGKPETGEADRKQGEAFFRYTPPTSGAGT